MTNAIADISIEIATLDDAPAIYELQRLAYQSEAMIYNDFSIRPLTETWDEYRNLFSGDIILKATDQGGIIGSVRGQLREGVCLVGRLIVHPDRQNAGLGTRLMQALETHFPQAQRFELFTGSGSVRNLHLYQKLGYRIVREEPINERLTLVYLEKTPE